MVNITLEYKGEKHCDLKHGPSGAVISTDAPKDNRGRGEAFSPTDLCASALGACMLTVMAMEAEGKGLSFAGAKASVVKEMKSGPRRIGKLTVQIELPKSIPEGERKWLEDHARNCPVGHSLNPAIEIDLKFSYNV